MGKYDVVFTSVIGGVVLLIIWLFIALNTGLDTITWTSMTNREDCYFVERNVNNVWGTPGESSSKTDIYCKVGE